MCNSPDPIRARVNIRVHLHNSMRLRFIIIIVFIMSLKEALSHIPPEIHKINSNYACYFRPYRESVFLEFVVAPLLKSTVDAARQVLVAISGGETGVALGLAGRLAMDNAGSFRACGYSELSHWLFTMGNVAYLIFLSSNF